MEISLSPNLAGRNLRSRSAISRRRAAARAIGPAVSWLGRRDDSRRLTSPTVGLMPTMPLMEAGLVIGAIRLAANGSGAQIG